MPSGGVRAFYCTLGRVFSWRSIERALSLTSGFGWWRRGRERRREGFALRLSRNGAEMEYYIRGTVMLTSWKLVGATDRAGQVIPYGRKFPQVWRDGKLHGIHCPSLNAHQLPRGSTSTVELPCDQFLWRSIPCNLCVFFVGLFDLLPRPFNQSQRFILSW